MYNSPNAGTTRARAATRPTRTYLRGDPSETECRTFMCDPAGEPRMATATELAAGDPGTRGDTLALAFGALFAVGAATALGSLETFAGDAVVATVPMVGAAVLVAAAVAGSAYRKAGLAACLALALAPVAGAALGPHVPGLLAGDTPLRPYAVLAGVAGGVVVGVVGFLVGAAVRMVVENRREAGTSTESDRTPG